MYHRRRLPCPTNLYSCTLQGPLYGLVGAWLVFLIKNREVIGKEKADNMTRQAIFLSALNVALGNPLPIDDW